MTPELDAQLRSLVNFPPPPGAASHVIQLARQPNIEMGEVVPDHAPRHRPAAGVGDRVDRLRDARGGQRFASVEALIKAADQALCTATLQDRNRLVRYEAGKRAPVVRFL